jgi:AcrR family transcriptional regulator
VAQLTRKDYVVTVTDATELSRRERRMAETRVAIVTAARALFREKGFVETTVDEIAERADVAQRTFFRYFPSKQAVLFSDFEDLLVELVRNLESRPPDEPPLQALFIAMCDNARAVEARLDTLGWVMETAEKCGGFGVEGAVLRDRIMGSVTRFLAGRLGVEPVVDPRPAAWAGTMFACFGAAMHSVRRTGGSLHDTFVDALAETSDSMRVLTSDVLPERSSTPR